MTTPAYTRRYQAWLAAGQPDYFSLWVRARWKEFYEMNNPPFEVKYLKGGIVERTWDEEMSHYVSANQDVFDDWLEQEVARCRTEKA